MAGNALYLSPMPNILCPVPTSLMPRLDSRAPHTGTGLQAGIRIIIALTNHWPEYGGMGWYVDNIRGKGEDFEHFYTDGRVVAAYQTWVRRGAGWGRAGVTLAVLGRSMSEACLSVFG